MITKNKPVNYIYQMLCISYVKHLFSISIHHFLSRRRKGSCLFINLNRMLINLIVLLCGSTSSSVLAVSWKLSCSLLNASIHCCIISLYFIQQTQYNFTVEKQECSFDSKVIANWSCHMKKVDETTRSINMRVAIQPGLSLNYLTVTKNLLEGRLNGDLAKSKRNVWDLRSSICQSKKHDFVKFENLTKSLFVNYYNWSFVNSLQKFYFNVPWTVKLIFS